ncbi:meiosis-specific protein ASY3 [Tanacetum coccineum]
METEQPRRLRDDHMSGNWSFGSNYKPCSQAGKMSIGIVVPDELHASQNVKSVKDVPAESKCNGKEGMSSDLGSQNKVPLQKSSPLIRRNTSDQNRAYPKVSSLPSTNNVPLQPSGNKIVDNMEARSYFASQMLNLRSRYANEKKSKRNFNQREGGNGGTIGREEESAYATPKKVPEPEKGTTEQGTSEKVNISRMKVQELLGTVISSPNKTQHNSQTFGMDVDKTKQRSKTNETDTLSPGKKPQAQKSVPKKQSPLCQSKQAHLDENAFSFVETWSKRSITDVSPGFKMFKRKERLELEIRPVKTCVIEEVHKDKSQKANDGRKTKAAATNTSLTINRKRDSEVVKQNTEGVLKDKSQKATDGRKTKAAVISASLFENRKRDSEVVKSDTEMKETSHNYSDDLMTSCQPGGNNGTTSKNDVDQNPFAKRSFSTNVDPQSDLKSPTFEFKSTTGISSPISSYKSSEDASPISVPIISKNRQGKKRPVSVSPCQEEDSESSEDDTPIKGDADCDKFKDGSQHDGLVGAVKLFALALERVERKIHSTTSKQSAAILLSVSENKHSQLQNAESKIQNEVGKQTNLGKSKRMHPEKQLREQQEQLKGIYEKFKEEVDQHLEKCRRTLEGLDQVQVKGMVEKQNTPEGIEVLNPLGITKICITTFTLTLILQFKVVDI